MINEIENYLDNKKNLIIFYLLSISLIGFIYYTFNYSILNSKIEENNEEIEVLKKKIKDNKSLRSKLKKLEKNLKSLKVNNFSLKEDIKYLNALINSSNIFNINQKQFFLILQNVLQKAVDNNIKASYKIKISANKFKVYSIYINGEFDKQDFFNFFNFIKSLESIKNIKKIQNLSLKKEGNFIKFSLLISLWSIL